MRAIGATSLEAQVAAQTDRPWAGRRSSQVGRRTAVIDQDALSTMTAADVVWSLMSCFTLAIASALSVSPSPSVRPRYSPVHLGVGPFVPHVGWALPPRAGGSDHDRRDDHRRRTQVPRADERPRAQLDNGMSGGETVAGDERVPLQRSDRGDCTSTHRDPGAPHRSCVGHGGSVCTSTRFVHDRRRFRAQSDSGSGPAASRRRVAPTW